MSQDSQKLQLVYNRANIYRNVWATNTFCTENANVLK